LQRNGWKSKNCAHKSGIQPEPRGKGVILIEKYLIQSGHEEKARDDDEQGEKE
jgi:hypothetical protein